LQSKALWDCRCGTRKLLAVVHNFCPACGEKQQGAMIPPPGEQIAPNDHYYVGNEVHCPKCGSGSIADAAYCGNCGHGIQVNIKNRVVIRNKPQVSESQVPISRFSSESWTKISRLSDYTEFTNIARGWYSRLPLPSKLFLWTFCFGIMAVAVALLKNRDPEVIPLRVEALSWKRSIDIEVLKPFLENIACNKVPADAKDVQKTTDGARGARCNYVTQKWTHSRTLVESGESTDSELKWPDVADIKECKNVNCERISTRTELFKVFFRSPVDELDEVYSCEVTPEEWRKYTIGGEYRGQRSGSFGGLVCDTLAPKNGAPQIAH
jgi:ribosomal protein S27AE